MKIFWLKNLLAICTGLAAGFFAQSVSVGAAVLAGMLVVFWMPIYFHYAKDNPQHFWFKRKIFGWGWTPVTWQGWLVIILYVAIVALFALTIDENSPTREVVFTFLFPTAAFTVLLIRICYRKGESPRWQWGKDIGKYQ